MVPFVTRYVHIAMHYKIKIEPRCMDAIDRQNRAQSVDVISTEIFCVARNYVLFAQT